MDEVSLYNRALSAAEVLAIYNAGAGGKCPLGLTPPSIITQPTNQTVTVGSGATFLSCRHRLTLFSRISGFMEPAASRTPTNSTLTLSNVQLSDAGTYHVSVVNPYGSTNSADATLTVTNPAPPCTPPPSGMVAWWPGEGNANDIVGNNNGTAVGGVTYTNGEVGQAFQFGGTNSYIQIPASDSLDVAQKGGLTIEAWVKPDYLPPFGNQALPPIVGWYSPSRAGVELYFQAGSSLVADLRSIGGANASFWTAYNTISTNVFQHIALTWDKNSGNASIYINGVQMTNFNFGDISPQTSFPVSIGKRTSPNAYRGGDTYNGKVDELSIYSRALSASEIQAIYAAGAGGKCLGPNPPTITTQPTNQTATVGNNLAFSVTAAGAYPLTYQWWYGTSSISNATNATLLLANVQLGDAGMYHVVVSNSFGSTNSVNALLTVNPFSSPCTPPPSGIVSWWRAESNAYDSIGGNNGVITGLVSFATGEVGQAFVFSDTNEDIKIPASSNLNLGLGAGFTLEAWINPQSVTQIEPIFEWNAGDGTTYPGVQFYIYPNPAGGPFPGALFANITEVNDSWNLMWTQGDIVKSNIFQHVALTYDKSSGLATIYCNGVNVAQQQTIAGFTPKTTGDLHLGRRPTSPDGSRFTFGGMIDEPAVYNRALSSSEIAAIFNAGPAGKCFAPAPPSITTQPTNQTVVVGSNATFSVVATGSPTLTYQWFHGTSSITNATNSTLRLANVKLSDAGTYHVFVHNLYGATNSANATLTVTNPVPSCTAPPTGLVAWWRGEGNPSDSVGTNNGVWQGTAAYAAAEVGQGFAFSGQNNVTVVDSPALHPLSSAITMETWIKVNSLSINANSFQASLISKGNSSWRLQIFTPTGQ